MKKQILLTALLVSTTLLFGQDAPEPEQEEATSTEVEKGTNARLYFSPGHFFTNTFQLALEFDMPRNGLMFVGEALVISNSSEETLGFGGEFQYRIDISTTRERPRRKSGRYYQSHIYAAPYFKFNSLSAKYTETQEVFDIWGTPVGTTEVTTQDDINSYGGGMIIGLRYTYVDKLTFDLYAGGGLRFSDVQGDESRYEGLLEYGYTGILPKVGFRIGVVL